MPAPRWYYARGDEVLGPFELDQLRRMVAAGTLGRADQVRPEGQSRWLSAASIPGLFTAPPPLLPTAPGSGTPQQSAGGTEAPTEPWRPVAAHGSIVGRWSAVASVALLGLYIAVSHPQKFSDSNFWVNWMCFGLFMGGAGYWVGHAVGFVVGRNAEKADVARAVTATATVAFFLVCLGMAAGYLSSPSSTRDRAGTNAEQRHAGAPPTVGQEVAAGASTPAGSSGYDGVWVSVGTLQVSGQLVPITENGVAFRLAGREVDVASPVLVRVVTGRLWSVPGSGPGTATLSGTGSQMPESFEYEPDGPNALRIWRRTTGGRGGSKTLFQREEVSRRSNYTTLSAPSLIALLRLYGMNVRATEAGTLAVEPVEANAQLARAVVSRELEVMKLAAPDHYLRKMLAGQWTMTAPDNNRLTYTFTLHKDMTATTAITDSNPVGNAVFNATLGKGTYEWRVKDGQLTMTFVSYEKDVTGFGNAALKGDATQHAILEVTDKTLKIGPPTNRRGGAFGSGSMPGATLRRAN